MFHVEQSNCRTNSVDVPTILCCDTGAVKTSLLILLVALAGCQTQNQVPRGYANYRDATISRWSGRSADDLIALRGLPDQESKAVNGDRVLCYIRQNSWSGKIAQVPPPNQYARGSFARGFSAGGNAYSSGYNATAPNAYIQTIKHLFWVNDEGTIYRVEVPVPTTERSYN